MKIYKLQRPLSGIGPSGWLLYSRGKTDLMLIDHKLISKETRAMIGDDPKMYFEGSISSDGMLRIARRLPDQDW